MADPSLSVEMESGNTIYAAGVLLEEAGDEDVISVTMPYVDQPLEVYGIVDLPGSDASPKVSLFDSNEVLLSEKEGVGPNGSLNYLFAKQEEYRLLTADVAGGGGPNHWFVLYLRTRPETASRNQQEQEPNDIMEDATEITQTTDTSETPNFDKGYIRGELLADGDEDWFRMQATEGGRLSLYCGSESYGAFGDLAVDIHGPDGALITTITEGNDSTPDVEDLGPLTAGTHSLRFYSEDGVYGLGVYYRCGLRMYQAE